MYSPGVIGETIFTPCSYALHSLANQQQSNPNPNPSPILETDLDEWVDLFLRGCGDGDVSEQGLKQFARSIPIHNRKKELHAFSMSSMISQYLFFPTELSRELGLVDKVSFETALRDQSFVSSKPFREYFKSSFQRLLEQKGMLNK